MSCPHDPSELVAFHFGDVDEATRAELEARLAGCAECLQAYFALKRDLEAPPTERPSEAARARLRLAVGRELGVLPVPARRRWAERSLAFAVAAAAVVATVGVTWTLTTRAPTAPHSLSR
jgi:anti-sigma factor RsiW